MRRAGLYIGFALAFELVATACSGSAAPQSPTEDGRFIVFESGASYLVPGDTNEKIDVFMRNRAKGSIERVSVSSSGAQGNRDSWASAVSADGRYIAFESGASNLVPGDTNHAWDVFVRDRVKGSTERVSVSSSGAQTSGWSYTRPLDSDETLSGNPSVSADGRYVAFDSSASNLVAGDTNRSRDVFLHDGATGTTERLSVSSSGAQGNHNTVAGGSRLPSVSADGRYVAFESGASNLVPGDTNGGLDIFVRDRVKRTTERVSISNSDAQGDAQARCAFFDTSPPSISADGRYFVFSSSVPNLVSGDTNCDWDVFVRDRVKGSTERVSVSSRGAQGNSWSGWLDISLVSPDGRYIAFSSDASNLVSGDTNDDADVFLHDRVRGTTERVSVSSSGAQNTAWSSYTRPLSVSPDGRYVAFYSEASNLVLGDTNGDEDVFVRDRLKGTTELVSVAVPVPTGQVVLRGSLDAQTRLAADGTRVAVGGWEVWNAATGSVVSVGLPQFDTPCSGDVPSDSALAWPRLADLCVGLSNNVWYYLAVSEDVRKGETSWRQVDWRSPGVEEPHAGTLGPLRGDRSLLVYNSYPPLKLWRIGTKMGKPTLIATGVQLADASQGRIAGWQSGSAVVLDLHGRVVRRFGGVHHRGVELLLDGTWLLVATRTGIVAYDIQSGRQVVTRPFRGGQARVESALAGLVAYIASNKLHVLRLSDGRDVIVQSPQRPFHARLSSRGLFYTSSAGVAFVIMRAIRASLE